MIEGKVEVARAGTRQWTTGFLNEVLYPGDLVRTGERSRAEVYLTNAITWKLHELSTIEIPPTPNVSFWRGLVYIFSRQRTAVSLFNLRGATAAIRGTDFLVRVTETNSELTVLDGAVELLSQSGERTNLTILQRGIVETNGLLRKTAVIEANASPEAKRAKVTDLVQWSLYYPGVLNVDDLTLSNDERLLLNGSLTNYLAGDLPHAVADYPWQTEPVSDSAKAYRAALLLSVGQVEQAQDLLKDLPPDSAPVRALTLVIAAVKFQPLPPSSIQQPSTSSEWLAQSYYWQSRASVEPKALERALSAARAATTNAPEFGFAWTRVAELEFSFRHTPTALAALENGLRLSPRNAQAVALQGFLFSAQDRIPAAISNFNHAISLDSALANAWLGRGLCKIRIGWGETGLKRLFSPTFGVSQSGLEDLIVAASLEPQRSLLHSYLGKGFADAGEDHLASRELDLAIKLDKKDPTPWLYSALLKQQENRINEAIADLETSQALNDNRSLFRSRLLLDEDSAVKSANLASIYRDAGMTDISVQEAARAVTYDYANDSAHLFLSDSYNELRDPTRFNLRYETVWFNELLLANILAPIGGGRLPLHVSEQEYSQLFQADGFHLANSTAWRSDNGSVNEQASQYGTYRWSSYSLDLNYQHNDGFRTNNGLDNIEWYSTIKQQITPQDTLLAIIKYEDYHSGDNFQYYYQTNARPNFHFDETQQPLVVGAWHHEWSPGIHTLALGGRLETEQTFSDNGAPQLLFTQNGRGTIVKSAKPPLDVDYQNQFDTYLAELNQIVQWDRLTLSVGGRWQSGSFQAQSQFTNFLPGLSLQFPKPVTNSVDENFQRLTGYGYLTLEPLDNLWLIGGLAYDDITYPDNFRNPPLSSGEAHIDQLGPKGGLVWSPLSLFTLRGDYTKSLGGVSEDQNFRLEQTQVAGFPQAFRTIIPESVVGSVSAPEYETYGAALELKFPSRTYAAIQAQRLQSDVNRTIGTLVLSNGLTPAVSSSTAEQLRYRESIIGGSINQLLGDMFVVGAGAVFDQVEFHDNLPQIPLPSARQVNNVDLYTASGYVLFNHPSGFFARADATWYHQNNSGYTNPVLPDSDFIQENVFLGYRFARRHVQLLFGILNLSDQNYHLNPLTAYAELPRERSYTIRFTFQF